MYEIRDITKILEEEGGYSPGTVVQWWAAGSRYLGGEPPAKVWREQGMEGRKKVWEAAHAFANGDYL